MASQRRYELSLPWTICVVFARHAFAQGRTELRDVPLTKLMRKGQPLQRTSRHSRLPRLPKKNGMTSHVLGPDGSLDSLHGSSLSELSQVDSSRDNASQAESWGWRRRWRRHFRRFKRKFNKYHKKLRKAAADFGDKYGSKLKELAKVVKTSLKACGAGAIGGLVTGNPAALANVAACVKNKALEVKSDAKAILSDAKAEAQAQGKDISSLTQTASDAAGATVAHIMSFGNQLEQQAKAGKLTAVQAIQALEDKAIKETINGTVAVERHMAVSVAKAGQAVNNIATDAKKASSEVSATDNGTSNTTAAFK